MTNKEKIGAEVTVIKALGLKGRHNLGFGVLLYGSLFVHFVVVVSWGPALPSPLALMYFLGVLDAIANFLVITFFPIRDFFTFRRTDISRYLLWVRGCEWEADWCT